ncbi:MAG: acyl-CoA dehydrogenase [Actinobacteria bacterium]|nr:acyl-CoA dehydrogenase [Actinomycetota bacterium]
MRFELTDEQVDLRDAVRGLLEDRCPPDAVRAAWDGDGRVRAAWDALVEMGVLGALVPESAGGLGMTDEDVVPLLVECGRVALPDPVAASGYASAVALGALLDDLTGGGLAADWSGRIASGAVLLPVVDAGAPLAGATTADGFLWCVADEVVLATPEDVDLQPQRSVDGARQPATVVRRSGEVVATGDLARRVGSAAAERLAVGAAAELVGLGERMLEMTVAYVGERQQFGVPVGSFQAVKHQLADAAIAVAFAMPLVWLAAHSLAHSDPDAGRHVAAAKLRASTAARHAAAVSLQCHGAIGYTVEYDLHLFMKRAWALSYEHGDPDACRSRLRAELGLAGNSR